MQVTRSSDAIGKWRDVDAEGAGMAWAWARTYVPSGKHLHNYGKIPLIFTGQSHYKTSINDHFQELCRIITLVLQEFWVRDVHKTLHISYVKDFDRRSYVYYIMLCQVMQCSAT